jgi:hypothetical protein
MFNDFSRTDVMMIAGPAFLFVVVLEMVRRRRLREDYSLLWLVMCVALILLAVFRDTFLYVIADEVMGIKYYPAALFLIGFGLLLLILLQFSLVITRLARENKQAAQHIALLGQRVHDLERQLEGNRSEA